MIGDDDGSVLVLQDPNFELKVSARIDLGLVGDQGVADEVRAFFGFGELLDERSLRDEVVFKVFLLVAGPAKRAVECIGCMLELIWNLGGNVSGCNVLDLLRLFLNDELLKLSIEFSPGSSAPLREDRLADLRQVGGERAERWAIVIK